MNSFFVFLLVQELQYKYTRSLEILLLGDAIEINRKLFVFTNQIL